MRSGQYLKHIAKLERAATLRASWMTRKRGCQVSACAGETAAPGTPPCRCPRALQAHRERNADQGVLVCGRFSAPLLRWPSEEVECRRRNHRIHGLRPSRSNHGSSEQERSHRRVRAVCLWAFAGWHSAALPLSRRAILWLSGQGHTANEAMEDELLQYIAAVERAASPTKDEEAVDPDKDPGNVVGDPLDSLALPPVHTGELGQPARQASALPSTPHLALPHRGEHHQWELHLGQFHMRATGVSREASVRRPKLYRCHGAAPTARSSPSLVSPECTRTFTA